jgi:hypothetical protein
MFEGVQNGSVVKGVAFGEQAGTKPDFAGLIAQASRYYFMNYWLMCVWIVRSA